MDFRSALSSTSSSSSVRRETSIVGVRCTCSPPSGGGSPKRKRRRCKSLAVRTFAGAPLPRRRSRLPRFMAVPSTSRQPAWESTSRRVISRKPYDSREAGSERALPRRARHDREGGLVRRRRIRSQLEALLAPRARWCVCRNLHHQRILAPRTAGVGAEELALKGAAPIVRARASMGRGSTTKSSVRSGASSRGE